jgi:large repetitive protein
MLKTGLLSQSSLLVLLFFALETTGQNRFPAPPILLSFDPNPFVATATLFNPGPDTICMDQMATLEVLVSNGTGPYVYQIAVNGAPMPPVVVNDVPISFPILITGPTIIDLVSFFDLSGPGNASGSVFIWDAPALSAQMLGSKREICRNTVDSLTIELEGSGPFTFSYAANGMVIDTLTTLDTLIKVPVAPQADTTIYTLAEVGANGCSGLVSGADTLILKNVPNAFLGGGGVICYGDSLQLCINLSGNGPFTIGYAANGVAQPGIITSVNPYCFYVHPQDTTTYTLLSVSAQGCSGTVGGNALVQVRDSLTAYLSGGGQICQGGSGTTVEVHFTGQGPYTFTYSTNNQVQPAITTSANPYILPANPNIGTFYRLVSLSNAQCTGKVADLPVIVFVFVPATAVLSGSQTFCDSADTNVTIDFTGTGPFTVSYTLNGVAQPEVNTFDDPYFIPVKTDTTQVYVLTGISSPGCTGNPVGSATVTIHYKPTFTNVVVNCNAAANTYTVEFDVVGATLPLTLVSGSGSFSGTHFTSNALPQANTSYSFSFRDANNCGNVVVSGSNACICVSQAATMGATPIAVCADQVASAVAGANFVNDGNDIQRFILHTNPGVPLGSIISWANTPDFSFINGMQTGVTYYISAIAGNPDGSGGNVDLNDPCLSVSAGTPVVFYALPNATLGNDISICSGAQAVIPVSLSGSGPYMLNWTVNGNAQTAGNIPGPGYLFGFQPLNNSVVILTSVSDAHCSRPLMDTALVSINPSPQIQNISTSCDLSTNTYTVTFTMVGTAPFTVSGINGTVTGNQFVSNPIPSGITFNAVLKDALNCGQDTESGTPDCSCHTEAGVLNNTPQLLCYGATASIGPVTGAMLEPGDTLVYALLNAGFAVVAQNTQPVFAFNPATITPGQPYTIVAYAGDKTGNGINLNDPCLDVAIGAQITWRAEVTASISGTFTVCPNVQAFLPVQLSGGGPYNLSYQAGASVINLPTTNLSQIDITIAVGSTTNVSLVSVSGAGGCAGTVSGSGTVIVAPQPAVQQALTTCNFSTNTYQLQFSVSNGAFPNQGYVISGIQGTLTDTSFLSAAIPSNQVYNVTITSPQGCTTVITGNANCDCVTDAGNMNLNPVDLCVPAANITAQHNNDAQLDNNDVLRFYLCTNPNNLPSSILASANQPQFPFQSGMTVGTTYYIVAVAGTPDNTGAMDWQDPCIDVSAPTEVHLFDPPTASISGDTSICQNNNIQFKIKFTGTGPFTFVYAINNVPQPQITAPLNSFTISSNNIQQAQVFTLLSVSDAHCTGTVSGAYTVNITTPPTASLSGADTICAGNSSTLSLQLSGGTSYQLNLVGGPAPVSLQNIQNGATVPVSPGATTTYQIANFVASGNTCPAQIGPGVTITVTTLDASGVTSDYNGFGVSCSDAQDGAINVSTTGGIAPLQINWSNNANGLNLQQLAAGSYAVTLSDQSGCVVTRSFTLTEPPPINFSASVTDPGCAEATGALEISTASGGVTPYFIGLNGSPGIEIDQLPYPINSLIPDTYVLEISDLNGCTTTLTRTIAATPLITVDLGLDVTLQQGETLDLNPQIGGNAGLSTFSWSTAKYLDNPIALRPTSTPDSTITYEIVVTSPQGCTATDQILIRVLKSQRVYIPNAIHPDASNFNNILTVYGGKEVVKVHYLRIYDRWGDEVFSVKEFQPNDTAVGWRGKVKNKDAQVGVYVYVTEVEFDTGEVKRYTGDVTVIR